MEKSNSGTNGHGMPTETQQTTIHEIKPNGCELPMNESISTTIHKSKNFPFVIVQQNEDFKIAVGTNLVTENVFTSIEEAEKYLNNKPWDVIVNLICATYNMFKQNEN